MQNVGFLMTLLISHSSTSSLLHTKKLFYFQFLSFSTEELYDVVTVRDGLSGDTEVLAGLSGGVTPDVLVSSTNYMVVQFKTDHSIHGAGFKATWRPGE